LHALGARAAAVCRGGARVAVGKNVASAAAAGGRKRTSEGPSRPRRRRALVRRAPRKHVASDPLPAGGRAPGARGQHNHRENAQGRNGCGRGCARRRVHLPQQPRAAGGA